MVQVATEMEALLTGRGVELCGGGLVGRYVAWSADELGTKGEFDEEKAEKICVNLCLLLVGKTPKFIILILVFRIEWEWED